MKQEKRGFAIKSRTGKVYYEDRNGNKFQTLQAAMDEAKARSTKKAAFTVYLNGKSVTAFINKKELPQPEVVFYLRRRPETSVFVRFECQNDFYREAKYEVACLRLDRINGNVRLTAEYKVLIPRETGHIFTFKKSSITFRPNGTTCSYQDGRLILGSGRGTRMPSLEIEGAPFKTFIDELCKLRPSSELALRAEYNRCVNLCTKGNRDRIDVYHIVDVFERPSKRYIVDEYRKTAVERPNDSPSHFTDECFPRVPVPEDKLVEILAKKYGVPYTKKFKRIYLADIGNIIAVRRVMDYGIINPDYICRLSNLATDPLSPPSTREFIEYMIKYRGMKNAVAMLEDRDATIISDCGRLLWGFCDDPETIEWVIRNSRNVYEIHDTLVYLTNKMFDGNKYQNRKIEYDKEEIKRINHEYGSVAVTLAKDTKELAVIGRDMGICVGGYADEAVSRRSTIVKMMDGKKYVACIEIRDDEIQQIKAKFNNPVKAEYKEYIDRWIKDANLGICTYDYNRIGDPWESTLDYHNVNPDTIRDEEEQAYDLRIIRTHDKKYEFNWLGWKEMIMREEYEKSEAEYQKYLEEERLEEEDWISRMAKKYEDIAEKEAEEEEFMNWVSEMARKYNR